MSDFLNIFLVSLSAGILSAAVGLGGGLLMLGLIPMFVPIAAVIPIQGVVNLSSNFSRFVFGLKDAMLQWLPAYCVGGMLGTMVGYPLMGRLPEKYFGVVLAVFILISVWSRLLKKMGQMLHNNYLVAAIQAFLALFVGSVATLSMPLLVARDLSTKQVIATSAMQMSVLNIFRVVAFFIAGFQFSKYAWVIVPLMLGSILGSYLGVRLQKRIPERIGAMVLKLMTTALAGWLFFQAQQK